MIAELRAFSQAGGDILFGTDIGYIDHYDTSLEFTLMSQAGMNFRQILASLTTNRAQKFGYSGRVGRVAKGMEADRVVLSADPALDATAFSKVRYTNSRGEGCLFWEVNSPERTKLEARLHPELVPCVRPETYAVLATS